MDAGGSVEEENKWPPWLKPLLSERFFGQCKLHADSLKSNWYCLDCMSGSLCTVCLNNHKKHRTIQIRKCTYQDVIRVSEIRKFLDIASVQTYVINNADVVFLNKRPRGGSIKGATSTCEACERSLIDYSRFCSIGCKIVGTSKNFERNKKISPEKKRLIMGVSDSDDPYRSGHLQQQSSHNTTGIHSFTQSTPSPTAASFRTAKRRRKGIPNRAPMG